MAYREKLAWLTLAAMAVAYGAYFTLLTHIPPNGAQALVRMVGLFSGVTIVQMVVVLGISIALPLMSQQKLEPKDERDRAIARRGASAAYYVLLIGVIVVGVVMPFSKPAWQIINAALLVLVIAETTRFGLIVYSYRRGWHG